MNRDAEPKRSERTLVLVLNWNGLEDSRACLRSLDPVIGTGTEVVLLDNGSEDGSADALEAEFPRVRVVRNGGNLLYAGGNNVGLRMALDEDFDFVCVLNNDTEVDPGFLDPLMDALRGDPGAAVAGPKILYLDRPDRIWSAGTRITPWLGWIRHRGIRARDTGRFDERCAVDALTGCCLLIRCAALAKIGLFDTGYGMFTEDTDWCTRARRRGWTCLYEPTSRVLHKVSASTGGGLTPYKAYHRVLSTWRYFRIYGSPWHWPGIFLGVGFGLLVVSVTETARGNRAAVGALWRGAFHVVFGRDGDAPA